MTIISKICKSLSSLRLLKSYQKSQDYSVMIKSLRKVIRSDKNVGNRTLSRIGEPVIRNFSKLAPIIATPARNDGSCGKLFTTRADERTTLMDIIVELVILVTRITLVLFVSNCVFALYLMTRIIYTKAFPGILLRAIEFLGPTFIKLGQWASTRRDIFPDEICKTLSRLQRHTPAHSWHYTKYLLEATYGPEWRNLFVKFDRLEPVGSGCCAQVYKAWIERKKAPVAVKILHPGIENRLKRDLAILLFFSECLSYLMPSARWLSLPDCIRQFSKIMKNQIDMNLEARNLITFSRNFSGNLNVIFPSPIMELTSRKILVESFHDCSPISEYVDCEDRNLQRKLAKIGIAAIFQMIFRDNFVHCDLHPGNILVEKSPIPRFPILRKIFGKMLPSCFVDETRLVFLDCGLVASLDERSRKNLRDVFLSVARGNGELAGQLMINHSGQRSSSDPEGFKRAIGKIVRNHLQSRLSLDNIKVGNVVAEFFEAIVRYEIRQDGSFASVILSMGVIEGLGRSLDPDIDIVAEVLPFLLRE